MIALERQQQRLLFALCAFSRPCIVRPLYFLRFRDLACLSHKRRLPPPCFTLMKRGGGGGGELGHSARCPHNVERQLRKRLLFLRDKVYRHHREFRPYRRVLRQGKHLNMLRLLLSGVAPCLFAPKIVCYFFVRTLLCNVKTKPLGRALQRGKVTAEKKNDDCIQQHALLESRGWDCTSWWVLSELQ